MRISFTQADKLCNPFKYQITKHQKLFANTVRSIAENISFVWFPRYNENIYYLVQEVLHSRNKSITLFALMFIINSVGLSVDRRLALSTTSKKCPFIINQTQNILLCLPR